MPDCGGGGASRFRPCRLGREPGQRERGRDDVDHARGVIPAFGGGNAGSANDQRHPQGRFEDQHAVRRLAMLAKAFAVIAGDDHRGPRRIGTAIDDGQQPRDLAST